MKAEKLLLREFDRLSEAPGAVAKLRQFVLELAVTGRLVVRDPTDGAADEVVHLTEAERARAGGLRTDRNRNQVSYDMAVAGPFAIPAHWRAVPLDYLASKLGAGSTPLGGKAAYTVDGVPFLRSQNVHNDGLRLDDVARIPRRTHQRMSGTHVRAGDLLLNITGASIGRCAIVPDHLQEANVSQHVAIVRMFLPPLRPFVHLLLVSPPYQRMIDQAEVGVSREGLSMGRLREFPVVLPPLEEQRRILSHVAQLLSSCDRLEVAQAERERRRHRLVLGAHSRLSDRTSSGSQPQFASLLGKFAELTRRPPGVSALAETILNMGVGGRLVPNVQDDSGDHLLSRLRSTKRQLVTQRERRSEELEDRIDLTQTPVEVPTSWRWVRMGDCCHISGGIQKTPARTPSRNSFPYVGVGNVYRGRLDLSSVRRFELQPGEIDRFRLNTGDLLVVEGNGSANEIGRCAIWAGEIDDCVHQNHIIRCRPFVPAIGPFILKYLNSTYGIEVMKALAVTSSGLYNLSVGKIRQIPVPLPPLGEQSRIVPKIDALVESCRRLELQVRGIELSTLGVLDAALGRALDRD